MADSLLAVLTFLGVLIAVLAAGAAFVALNRTGTMRRDYRILQGRDGGADFVSAVARHVEEVAALRAEVRGLDAEVTGVQRHLSDALRHVSVVRYDAFGDMGGRLSFSAALLDDGANGLVVTSIHGRTDTRTYMKGVRDGRSDATLSVEEEQAIEFAMRGVQP